MSRNQSFAHDPSSVRGVRDMVMSRPLPDVKSVPPNLKAFCHPHMYYIRLLFDVDKSSEPQRRVVIVVNDSIIFCDYKNRSIKRVLPICSIQCIYIQKKDEANNRIVRRAWLKTGDSTNELDVLLQQDEFQGSPANEDINELVHICRVIKSHKYHVSLPVLEENDRVFLSSARLGKGDTLKTLGGITDTKFGPDYAPEEPRSDKLALPPNIDTREWTSAELEMPASFNQSSEQMLLRKQSSGGFSTSQAQFSNKLQANQVVSETSELSSCLESEVSSLEDTQMFLARKEERVLEKKKQAEQQQQQQQPASPLHQPPPPSAQQQQQPPHPHPHHAYHHPPHYAHPGYHPPAYAPSYPHPHPHQHQHPHHAPHYHDHSPQQQQQQQQHPSLPHSYQQFRPPPLALGRQQPQQAPQPQHASPAPHHAPPPQQHHHHHHHHHHHPHSHHPSHHHSPPALHPPQQHSPPPHRPSPYSTAAAATGSQAPQRQQTRLPSPQPRLTVTARELEAPAPAPGPAAAATAAAAAAAPSVAASSASGWGPPDRLHGTRLFEAMGEEYARLRLQQMLAGEQQGGGGGGGAAVAPAASSRASSAGIVEEWQRPSSRSPPRPQQPPPPPPQRAAPATHKHRQSRRSDSRAREGSPRKSRRGGGSEGEGVGTLADTIFSGPVSVDVELYDRLRPQGTRLPRTRGGGRSDAAEAAAGGSGASGGGGGSRSSGRRAPASSGQGSEKGVGHFRTELRDEFWKHYMHTYDTACARSNVGGGDSARRRGAASPSRRDGSPRQKDAHRRAPGSHML